MIESPKFLLCIGGEKNNKLAFENIKKLLTNSEILTNEIEEKIQSQYKTYAKNDDDNARRSKYSMLFDKEYINKSLIMFFLFFLSSFLYYGLIYILPQIYAKLIKEHHEMMEINSSNNNPVYGWKDTTSQAEFTSKTKSKVINENPNEASYHEIINDIILSCIIETPITVFSGILPNLAGRKGTLLLGYGLGIIANILSIAATGSLPLISSFNKSFGNIPLNTLALVLCELFPSFIRSTALGTSNFFGKLGGLTTSIGNEWFLGYGFKMPFVMGSIISLVCFILSLMLEETLGKGAL